VIGAILGFDKLARRLGDLDYLGFPRQARLCSQAEAEKPGAD
jgi:hypothetical protein